MTRTYQTALGTFLWGVLGCLVIQVLWGCSRKCNSNVDTATSTTTTATDTEFSFDSGLPSDSAFGSQKMTDTQAMSETTDAMSAQTESQIASDTNFGNDSETTAEDVGIGALLCDPVKFEDPNFEAVIRGELELQDGLITEETMSSLMILRFNSSHNVTNISGIECAQSLYRLGCNGSPVESFAMLAYNRALGDIRIENCNLSDIHFVYYLENLAYLNVSNNRITSLEPLRGHQFNSLILDGNILQELAPLEDVQALYLSLSSTEIHELPPMVNMGVTNLIATGNYVADVAPVADIGLGQSPKILPREIFLQDNAITDLSPLLEVLGYLSENAELDFSNNPLGDETINVVIPELCEVARDIRWGEDGSCGNPGMK